jgi:protein-S-isoprenylcysteine O-methyltransferase Ste14
VGSRLVSGGIYHMMRHPIYAGAVLLALAWAFWRASLLHLALAVVIAAFFAAKARREEQWLLERFPDYAAYRREVRGFVPRIR